MSRSDPSTAHCQRARSSLQQALKRYGQMRRQPDPRGSQLQATVQEQLDTLAANLEKLDQGLIRIAAFGLVSRGKSAVLNALLGQRVLQTGPTHGVTQWPRSVRWTVRPEEIREVEPIDVELIDTPGLDEVAGHIRGEMAREVSRQADLILFVVSGDLTRTEYEAIAELKRTQKPLIIVFNKIDLYPESEQEAIYRNLEKLAVRGSAMVPSSIEIVRVAAEPTPLQVRVEWPNGRTTQEWESPPPQIQELQRAIATIVYREGRSLLALNALVQAREADRAIARQTVRLHRAEAEDLIWKFTQYKAIAVAINPVAFLDVAGAFFADLLLIRALAKLYGLPITSYEAGKLWRQILAGSGAILLGEIGSGLLLGIGKTGAVGVANFPGYAGAAITQAAIAGYGTYVVGRAAQVYLEQGCTWGEYGIDTVIQEIINQCDRETVIYRLRQEFDDFIG
ncbi:GTPase [Arthrospira sp. O9.13F]|nr:GTPase [Arthrospira sp. O9.13F]